MTQTASDADLIRAFVDQGDEESFQAIVSRHGSMVNRVCYRVLGNSQDAEDSTQAVFIILARKAASLSRQEALSSWLYGVARNLALQLLRKRTHSRQHEEEFAMLNSTITPGEQAMSEADRKLLLSMVDQELATLTERQRQAVILRYLENHSQETAAQIAGCPASTLATRASDGLARLRRSLAKQGLALSVPVLAAALTTEAEAAVSASFLSTVTATAVKATAHTAGNLVVNPTVNSLVEGGIKMIWWSSVKKAALIGIMGLGVPVAILVTGAEVMKNRKMAEEGGNFVKTLNVASKKSSGLIKSGRKAVQKSSERQGNILPEPDPAVLESAEDFCREMVDRIRTQPDKSPDDLYMTQAEMREYFQIISGEVEAMGESFKETDEVKLVSKHKALFDNYRQKWKMCIAKLKTGKVNIANLQFVAASPEINQLGPLAVGALYMEASDSETQVYLSMPVCIQINGRWTCPAGIVAKFEPSLGIRLTPRQMAEKSQALNTARQIGIACLNYANKYVGILPDRLSDVESFLGEKIKAQAVQDFEYVLAPGTKMASLNAKTVMIRSKYALADGTCAVIYGDCHGQFVPEGELEESIQKQKQKK